MGNNMIQAIQQHSISLTNFKDDLDPLVTTIKNQKYILLRNTHTEPELYKIRTDMTKKLIVKKVLPLSL